MTTAMATKEICQELNRAASAETSDEVDLSISQPLCLVPC
eukprot:CAMPEP_0194765640 /NCGR_PEP_ID=MMETSP0323_2-20130528/27024_1 /TAXON_ID=2866 ORGANISM="Crypthecodinium cohnii, Strain Seligo" /NCGR_SAMPLE_ID=MMETSP0323_2 /ASSEMBLY_ACC=CAM_ASM_000346 /LENGTH=39 /DNA_ID= /DNA_START= /DNA_END= /DNA_ORIENTATION=